MRTCPFKQNSLLICQAMQHSEVQVWPKSNIQLCKLKMMYSKFRCKLLANDSSIFIWVLIAEYYCARGAQLVKVIRLLRRAVIWPMLYLVIRNNSFTFTFTDYSSNAGYMVRQDARRSNCFRFRNSALQYCCLRRYQGSYDYVLFCAITS